VPVERSAKSAVPEMPSPLMSACARAGAPAFAGGAGWAGAWANATAPEMAATATANEKFQNFMFNDPPDRRL